MNVQEWVKAAQEVKALQVKMDALLLLSAMVDLGEDAKMCDICGKVMVPHTVWKHIEEEDRPTLFAGECGEQGICAPCAGRERAKNRRMTRTGGPLSDEEVQRLRAAVNFPGRGMR